MTVRLNSILAQGYYETYVCNFQVSLNGVDTPLFRSFPFTSSMQCRHNEHRWTRQDYIEAGRAKGRAWLPRFSHSTILPDTHYA